MEQLKINHCNLSQYFKAMRLVSLKAIIGVSHSKTLETKENEKIY
jgi:hypothetical protein